MFEYLETGIDYDNDDDSALFGSPGKVLYKRFVALYYLQDYDD